MEAISDWEKLWDNEETVKFSLQKTSEILAHLYKCTKRAIALPLVSALAAAATLAKY